MKPRVAAAAVALLLGAVLGGACNGGVVHAFSAYPYNVALGCLEAIGAVDVLDGPDPGACPGARCWVTPNGTIYVTDQACDAPIDFIESTTGPCKSALQAYKKRTMCGAGASSGAGSGG